ncbi:MAG: pyridoxamine 5'-phosphate oxidase family protein [Pseudomonadota bacterium]
MSNSETVANPVFSASVKAAQARLGSRKMWSNRDDGWRSEIDTDMSAWLAERDSFYFATASADGQPYIQHRGGPKGGLKQLGPTTLGFADFTGNRQYLTVGNLTENPKAHIFVMDYANRQRVKFWGTARIVEDDEEILSTLVV